MDQLQPDPGCAFPTNHIFFWDVLFFSSEKQYDWYLTHFNANAWVILIF